MAGPSAPRLDYNKPPPGYTADGQWWSHPPGEPSKLVFFGGYVDARNIAKVAPNDGALPSAWAHYKAHNDPPGCTIGLVMKGQGATTRGDFIVDWGTSQVAAVPAYKGKAQRAGAYQEARAAAWVWYDRRHALAERLYHGVWCPECYSDDAHVTALDAKTTSQPWCTECEVEMGGICEDVWPRCLAWTDEQAAEVEQFLQSPVAPPPGVLADEDEVSP